jgi:hypothetical protein
VYAGKLHRASEIIKWLLFTGERYACLQTGAKPMQLKREGGHTARLRQSNTRHSSKNDLNFCFCRVLPLTELQ